MVEDQLVPQNLKDPGWTGYGFQSVNPRTDFRGAGILAVINLRYFSQSYRIDMDRMRATPMFFFALSSIQVTHFIIVHLHMSANKGAQMPELVKQGAKKTQLKHMLSMLARKGARDTPIDMLSEL